MVCEELVRLSAFRKLSRNRQAAVFLAALLHDIGKIATTRWEDEKWTSPNHTVVGAKMAREFLWKEGNLCGTVEKQQLRETICNLIRYHSVPAYVIEHSDGMRKLRTIAANGQNCPMFNIELLCILAYADALGRDCENTYDRTHMVEQVQLCEELAKESGCYTAPFVFPSFHTQYAYLAGRNIQPELELYNDTWGEVILLSGLPGTGKDTWIKKNCPDLPMISLDKIRKEMGISPTDNQSKTVAIAREQAKEFLRKKQSFVYNATNLSPMIRNKQCNLFERYHAAVRVVYLETTWEEQFRRNQNREDAVPETAIYSMMDHLIPPEAYEAHKVEWYCI